MPNRLHGKTAVVTGGASGIGAATSRLFLEEGASVVIADLQPPSDAKLLATLETAGGRAAFLRTDVLDEQQVRAAIDAAVNRWGRLDIAVACAGVPGQGSAADLSEAEWDRILGINAKGVFFVTKHAIPAMLAANGGSIINISSVYGIIGAPGFAAYCASKGAVRTFTKSAAIEYGARGIRSNSIHPGVIETPMLHGLFARSDDPAATRAAFSAQQPNGFNGEPEDIAWGCVYLASDEARFVNGVELAIDGGLIAR
jgi:NAD(P)-dependent dehydrogenase (short-subunit alcohol dehydrogenase family)